MLVVLSTETLSRLERLCLLQPLSKAGGFALSAKNPIFVVGRARYLPITAEMKSYELSFGQ